MKTKKKDPPSGGSWAREHFERGVEAASSPRQLLLKLTDGDRELLDKLVQRWDFLSHTSLAAQAMRIGLHVLDGDPQRLGEAPTAIAAELKNAKSRAK
ncbi:MAG: hypothetical protein IT381_12540 [Deltaproteobacteria bacterium]|nr:hypothetical protein [Deltaproteobacteria bacterium]